MPLRTRPPGHIEIGEAVRRALCSEHYQGSRKPEAVRCWIRRLARTAIDEGKCDLVAHGDTGRLWIHPALSPALSELPNKERAAVNPKPLSDLERARAAAKEQALRDLVAFRRAHRLGKTDGRRRFAAERATLYTYDQGRRGRKVLKLTAHRLLRWQRAFDKGGLEALAADGRGRRQGSCLSDDAVALYWTLRADPRRYRIAHCFRMVSHRAAEAKWRWFKTQSACEKWDRRTRGERQRGLVLCQRGEEAFTRHADGYLEQDPESYQPGECIVGDDHTCDCWVLLPSGECVRPVISVWQDWRSRLVYGWCLIREGNQHALLLALRRGVDQFGFLPDADIVDNGKPFVSQLWRGGRPVRRTVRRGPEVKERIDGILNILGIKPSYCLPYNPNGKARLERWFRTLEDQCIRSLPSYCGNCSDNRPEAHKDLIAKAIPWAEFVAIVERYIRAYNERPHSAEDMSGYSPMQMIRLATGRRIPTDDQRVYLLAAWHKPVKVNRLGVSLKICGLTRSYGANHPALCALPTGTRVRVSYDPEDLNRIQVWTCDEADRSRDYKHICEAEANQRFNRSLTSEALREAMRAKRRRYRTVRDAMLIGSELLRDPAEEAIASLQRDSSQSRRPDPPGPDGGRTLVPVQSPVQVPEQRRRKAAGAEGMELPKRLDEFQIPAAAPERIRSPFRAMADFVNGGGK